jgi:rubrerythrin
MNDRPTFALIESIFRRESRSLLQYIRDSFPWTPKGEQDVLVQVRQMADEQRAEAGNLAQFLTRQRHTVPYTGSYPTSFTTINYAALDYVLPRLVADEQRGVARLEKDLAAVNNEEGQRHLKALLEMKRQHLKRLTELAAAHPLTVIR